MFDLNDAQPQMPPLGEVIPDGTFARIRMTIRPGGADGAVPMDKGLLKASSTSDARMLDCEFTVVDGPFAKRKFWQNFTISGGKVDEKGVSKGWTISKATFRAMVDSALGLDPKDEREAARQKRVLQGLRQLDGISFAGRIMIEPASGAYNKDTNKLANVVLPGEPQYQPVMRGEAVAPEPASGAYNKDTNKLANVVLPGEPQYQPVMRGGGGGAGAGQRPAAQDRGDATGAGACLGNPTPACGVDGRAVGCADRAAAGTANARTAGAGRWSRLSSDTKK